MKIDTGIGQKERRTVAEGLSRVLADSYTLYLKTHSFHWNVTGPLFPSLHLLFEQQYTELALAVDLIAERIRALGVPAPGSYSQFAELATVREATGVPPAAEMVRQLAVDHETVVRTIRAVLPVAQSAADEASLELLVGRLGVHEKAAWMLRSSVG
jgi:starvation-inducible DNA-binding protein